MATPPDAKAEAAGQEALPEAAFARPSEAGATPLKDEEEKWQGKGVALQSAASAEHSVHCREVLQSKLQAR